ncbi:Clavaminate synthase-like protein [Calocera cornea HHB12733]|uniref:Clavaminate synthase-like protein n=1 Tax=Calocera cornea HHB12733 TaxID=1353952 RepID=A0A165CVQ2_9BASI|nr:Clavaminate synthase-like protein [Calocera cornea HHB12733]
MEQVLRKVSQEYQALNGTDIERVEGKYVKDADWPKWLHIGRPVLIENYFAFGRDEPGEEEWTDDWLVDTLGSLPLSIAVTPDGEADALKVHSDGRTYFVEPLTEQEDIGTFLASFQERASEEDREVRYLQSQNGNIYNASIEETELRLLQDHIPVDVPIVLDSLGTAPDAVNLWIGDRRSVTSLHSDPYENVYYVVRGTKYFTLFPPTETFLFDERLYPHATYARSPTGALQLHPSHPVRHPPVRWLSFDPARPPSGTQPIHLTLRAGETLYLPAGWNHYVSQAGAGAGGGEGVCVAVNWWYDVQMRGMQWVWLALLRRGTRYLEDDAEVEEEVGEEARERDVPGAG